MFPVRFCPTWSNQGNFTKVARDLAIKITLNSYQNSFIRLDLLLLRIRLFCCSLFKRDAQLWGVRYF